MAPLTFMDMHNMVLFLSKSDTSDGFDQIVDFLNAFAIRYSIMVNPTIYVSCIKQFWATATLEKCIGAKRTAWNEFSSSMASAVICLAIDTSDDFDQIVDFLNAFSITYSIMVNPTIYVSCIKQFWATATLEKVIDDVQLQAIIDDKKVVVTEAIIRRDLHLDDADGVECLPNAEIFKELTRMGYEKPPPKLTFYKAFFFWNGSF
nr:xylulose kinase-1 [Tanacetum cinerariifolium]